MAVFSLAGFACVLFTYFGVNERAALLSGLAGPTHYPAKLDRGG